ncbi:TetR/AcrR family transcriptional regulator [Gillisia sp. M10.2A]|uniref:TetR/AcrR family transcriptional regulator n=1 Tax=Gillisia lutea TaxID=2909668 RepID=A0ABS9EBP4_9FLAO|nr:TetR/AcrR family transcriptional regulator [Gillisia lutea]MCF4100309.1 TetR/AcrR family transcriptional regulator [Gillisia lutea]
MREKILEKAAEMFLNIGFKSVTMDDIANELGISKKTIYTHFSTKSKLVEAAALYIFDTISTGIKAISKQELNVVEETYAIKNFALTHLKSEKSSPLYQLNKYYPKVAAVLREKQFEVMQDCVVENLQRGIASGHYRKDIPIPFISRIYFAGITGIKDNNLFPIEDFGVIPLMENYLEYHVRAIVTEKGLTTLNKLINDKTIKN